MTKQRGARATFSHLSLDQRTSYRFSIIARRQTRCLADMQVTTFGLSVNGWKLLSVIEYFGSLSASEAGAHTSLEPAKVTRGIDALTFTFGGSRVVMTWPPFGPRCME